MFKLQVLIIPQRVLTGAEGPGVESGKNLDSVDNTGNNTNANNNLIFGNNSSSPNPDSNQLVISTPLPTANNHYQRLQQGFNPNGSYMMYPGAFIPPQPIYQANNFNSKIKKFLHITSSSNTLETIAYEINQRFLKLYPAEDPLHILTIQNSEECDLDPDYTASMVFDNGNICRVIVANEFNDADDSLINNHGKRYLTGELNSVMKKVRKSKNASKIPENTSLVNTSIWSFGDDSTIQTNNHHHHHMNKPLALRDERETSSFGANISLAIPDIDDTVIHPSKSEYLKLASPIVATGSPTRITSGMLNVNSQPDLSKTDYAEDINGSMYIEQEGRASVSTKEDALKKNTKKSAKANTTISEMAAPTLKLIDDSSFIDNADLSSSSLNVSTTNITTNLNIPEPVKTGTKRVISKVDEINTSTTSTATTTKAKKPRKKATPAAKAAAAAATPAPASIIVDATDKERIAREDAETLEAEKRATEKAAREISERIAREKAGRLAKEEAEQARMLKQKAEMMRATMELAATEKAVKERLVEAEAEKKAKERVAQVNAAKNSTKNANEANDQVVTDNATAEQEKKAAEKLAKEKADHGKKEAEKLAKENADQEKKAAAEKEKTEKAEKAAADKLAKEQGAKEKAERISEEKSEKERLAQEKAEKLAKEKAEKERLVQEKAAADKLAKEQAAKEKAERLAKEKAEKERIAQEKAAADKLAKEQAAKEKAERLAKEKAEKERLVQEKAEQEKKAAAEKLAKEKTEKERLAKEKVEKEKAEKERLAKEKADKLAKEKAEKAAAKLAKEKADQEKRESAEKLAKEQATAAVKIAKDKSIRDLIANAQKEAKAKIAKANAENETSQSEDSTPARRTRRVSKVEDDDISMPEADNGPRILKKPHDAVVTDILPDEMDVDAEDDDISAIKDLTRDDTPEDEKLNHPAKAVKVTKLSVGSLKPRIVDISKRKTSITELPSQDKANTSATKNNAARRDEISGDIDMSNILTKKKRVSKPTGATEIESISDSSSSDSDSDSSDDSSEDEKPAPKVVSAPKKSNIPVEKMKVPPPNPIKITPVKLSTVKEELQVSTKAISTSAEISKRSSLPRLSAFLDKKLPEVRIQKQQAKVAEKKPSSDSDSNSSDSDSSGSSSGSDSDSASSDSDSDSESESDDGKSSFINSKTASQFVTKRSSKSKTKKNKGFSALMKDSKK